MLPEPTVREPLLAAIPRLRALARALCRDREEAEELVQGALLRAWDNIDSFVPGSNMQAWLCNPFNSEYRRQRRFRRAFNGLAETQATNPSQIASAEYSELCAAFAKLDSVVAVTAAMLVLAAATGSLGRLRQEPDSAAQLAQYCDPKQQSDAPDAPRIYCLDEHG